MFAQEKSITTQSKHTECIRSPHTSVPMGWLMKWRRFPSIFCCCQRNWRYILRTICFVASCRHFFSFLLSNAWDLSLRPNHKSITFWIECHFQHEYSSLQTSSDPPKENQRTNWPWSCVWDSISLRHYPNLRLSRIYTIPQPVTHPTRAFSYTTIAQSNSRVSVWHSSRSLRVYLSLFLSFVFNYLCQGLRNSSAEKAVTHQPKNSRGKKRPNA